MNSDKKSDALRSTMKSKSDSISCEKRPNETVFQANAEQKDRARARANAKTCQINKSYCH